LVRGMTPAMIEEEFGLSSQAIARLIAKLQDLGLVRRVSANSIKILVMPAPDQKGGDDLSDLWRKVARQFLAEIDLREEGCEWFYNHVRLSPASAGQLRELIERFVLDVRALGTHDVGLPADKVNWYNFFICAKPKKLSLSKQQR
jgi:MarR family protein